MFVWQLLKTNPMAGIALLMTLATLFWCLRLIRWQHTRMDRYLMGLLGLIAMYQGTHIIQNAGFWSLHGKMLGLNGAVDMTIAALYLIATLILQISLAERHNTKIQLRVVEANQPTIRPARPKAPAAERTALAVFGVNATGEVSLWHGSSEEFFGWRKDEVLGTRLPFREPVEQTLEVHDSGAGQPKKLRLRTKHQEEMEAIVWYMSMPDEPGSLVLVLDCNRSVSPEPANVPSAARPIPEFSTASPRTA